MRARELIPLASGEVDMIRRALRCYMNQEQRAIQDAVLSKNKAHAADVKRQNEPRIKAAGELLDRLLKDRFLTQGESNEKV